MMRLLLTVMMIGAALASVMMHAFAAEPLFISHAQVDVMGQNAEDARALAMVQAKREALKKLLQKFVPEHQSSIMDGLDSEAIDDVVRNISIANEKVDGNRFRGDVSVSYSAAMFNDLITHKIEAVESDQQLLTTASLILPVFETDDRLYLFESTNPWAVAWADTARNIGRGQLITPYGDSVDYSLVDTKKVLSADFKTFSPVRRRYGVRDVIILHAKLLTQLPVGAANQAAEDAEEQKETLVLRVRERRVQAKEDEIKIIEYTMDADEDKDALMHRAARDLGLYVMNLQGQTADKIAAQQQVFESMILVMPVTTMQRFNWIREKLDNIPGIEKVEIMALKPKQADVRIFFSSTREILLQSMLDAGLEFDDRTEYVEIRL